MVLMVCVFLPPALTGYLLAFALVCAACVVGAAADDGMIG
jgi:hypothetical protein